MISIFIFYSPDRQKQLKTTINCLEEMDYYSDCQKILCVDGSTNIHPNNFEVHQVPRNSEYYCWADAWKVGIENSKHDIILYLDSDRILPKDYLKKLLVFTNDNRIIYSKKLFKLKRNFNTGIIKNIRDACVNNFPRVRRFLRTDFRMPFPCAEFGKNPISGNTSMTKETYLKSGGIDPRFQGWGFPDTDYFMNCVNMGVEFLAIDCIELHQKHSYAEELTIVRLMNLWNGIQFCKKWGIRPGRSMIKSARSLRIKLKHAFQKSSFDDFKSLYSLTPV